MSTDNLLWYFNLANIIAIAVSLIASFALWRLTLRHETGADNRRWRKLAAQLQFSFMALAAAATFALWQYSLVATKEADAKISEAKSTASSAQKEAGGANERAGQANERAAALEKEAAEARERHTKLQADNLKLQIEINAAKQRASDIELGLSPRKLDKDQISRLSNALRISGIQKVNLTILGEAEARAFGMNVLSALKESGIDTNVQQAAMLVPTVYGITAYGKDAYAIVRAFETVGIRFVDISEDERTLSLTVGLKEPKR